jgi:hypothetical protein
VFLNSEEYFLMSAKRGKFTDMWEDFKQGIPFKTLSSARPRAALVVHLLFAWI